MLARIRALAPDGTRVSRLAGKSVGVAKAKAFGVSPASAVGVWALTCSANASWVGSAGEGCAAMGGDEGGSGVPPGSIARGSVG